MFLFIILVCVTCFTGVSFILHSLQKFKYFKDLNTIPQEVQIHRLFIDLDGQWMLWNFIIWGSVFSTLVLSYIPPTGTHIITVSTVMEHPFCRTFTYGSWGEIGNKYCIYIYLYSLGRVNFTMLSWIRLNLFHLFHHAFSNPFVASCCFDLESSIDPLVERKNCITPLFLLVFGYKYNLGG